MLVRVYENFTRGECRILRNFSLCEFFNLKGQDIRYLESVARLKMFPIFAGIQFLDERLGGMIAFRHKFQQRRVRQPFQSRLLSMTAWNVAHKFQVFFFDCVSGVSHRDLIEHPLVDRTGLWHRMGMFV